MAGKKSAPKKSASAKSAAKKVSTKAGKKQDALVADLKKQVKRLEKERDALSDKLDKQKSKVKKAATKAREAAAATAEAAVAFVEGHTPIDVPEPIEKALAAPGPDASWTVTKLRSEARGRGVAGYSRMTKAQLLSALEKTA